MRIFAILTPALGLAALLALTACGSPEPVAPVASTPAPAVAETTDHAKAAPANATSTAEITPAAPVEGNNDAAPEAAVNVDNESASEEDTGAASPAADEPATDEPAAAPDAPKMASVVPEGPEPRLNVDYQIIDPPQPITSEPGKVEIAVVFSYTCIHCAKLDPLLPDWEKTLPEQVNFIQVPMANGAFEPIARGFYAAQAMGVFDQTHAEMFKALAEQQRLGGGKLDDIAKIYAGLGVDATALKATATSFAVNAKIKRNQTTVVRWGIEGTPSIVVAGKYRVIATANGGHQGMLQAARWLAQKEIADHQAQ